MISSDEAVLLLSKYQSESTRLRVFFRSRDKTINFRVTARIRHMEGLRRIDTIADNGDFALLTLDTCRFEYGDSREVPGGVPEELESAVAGLLTAIFPSGERVYFLELR